MRLRTKFIASHFAAIVALCLFFLVSQSMLHEVSRSLEAIKTERVVREKLLHDARDRIYAIQVAIMSYAFNVEANTPGKLPGQIRELDERASDFYLLLTQLREAFRDDPVRIQAIYNAFQAYYVFAKRWLNQLHDPERIPSQDVVHLFEARQRAVLELIDETASVFAGKLDKDFIAVNLRLTQLSGTQLLLVLTGAAFTLLLFTFLARVLTQPIQELIRAVRQVEKGGYATTIPVRHGDELGDLGQAFNRMTAAILEKQDSLVRAERRYRSIFENAVEGLFQSTPEGRIVEANPVMVRTMGYDSHEQFLEEVHDVGFQLYAVPEERTRFLDIMRRGEAVHGFEVQLIKRDGRLFWAKLHANPIFDAAGELSRIDGILEDISIAKATEMELEEYRNHLQEMVDRQTRELDERNRELARAVGNLSAMNDRLQGLVENSPDAIYLKDEKGTFILTNERFDRIFRTHSSGDHESAGGTLQTPDPLLLLESLEAEAARERQAIHKESPLIVHGDHLIYSITVFPILGTGGSMGGLCGMMTDVTRDRLIQMEAIHTSQLASIGELAAGVAHEINNPINGIINYAQMLNDRAKGDEEISTLSMRIMTESERIATIVRSLLSFARKPGSSRTRIKLPEILQEVLNLTMVQLSKNAISLDITCPETFPEARANVAEIQQVLINIITNARHALAAKDDSDKRIRIVGSMVQGDDGVDMIRLTIEDNGVGIRPEYMDRLFDPFFTTKSHGQGTGLGLYLCRRIIRDHGGSLAIQSEEGRFTKVLLDLPVAEKASS